MKNNNQELKVILSKVAWCGHCTNFLPVFNKSQKLTKNNKYLKDINVNFEVYDMEEDLKKFKSNNYEDLLPQINGYPTVIVTSLKNGTTNVSCASVFAVAYRKTPMIIAVVDCQKYFQRGIKPSGCLRTTFK